MSAHDPLAPPRPPLSAERQRRLAAALRAQHGLSLEAARPLGQGWGAAAYRLPDPQDGGDWVLRVPVNDWAYDDLAREMRLLPALEPLGLPTPRGARAVLDHEGQLVAALHRYVEGRRLRRADLRHPRRRDSLAQQLGGFFAQLHVFAREQALALGLADDRPLARYREMAEACMPLLGPRSREWVRGRLNRFEREGGMAGAPSVLVHGDIAPSNLLLDEDGALRGVIDFGSAMLSDPALDFGGLLFSSSWPFVERVLEEYERARGEAVDAHLRRRAQFYVDVEPLFSVRYGETVNGGRERAGGLRKVAARAAAEARGGRRA